MHLTVKSKLSDFLFINQIIQHTGQMFLTSFVTSRSALVANIWPCEVHGPLHSWFTSKIGDTVHKSFEDSNHGVVNGFYEVFFSLTQKLPKLEQQTSWRISATGVQSEHSVSSDKRSAEKIQNTGGWRKRETGVCAALCNLTLLLGIAPVVRCEMLNLL